MDNKIPWLNRKSEILRRIERTNRRGTSKQIWCTLLKICRKWLSVNQVQKRSIWTQSREFETTTKESWGWQWTWMSLRCCETYGRRSICEEQRVERCQQTLRRIASY